MWLSTFAARAGKNCGLVCLLVAALAGYAHWPHAALPEGVTASRVVVLKSDRRLQLYEGDTLLQEYSVSLGFSPVGQKQIEGDGKTPEGSYFIDKRNPNSQYHLSLHVSYPTAEQTQQAIAMGVNPGGLIMIHGIRNGLGVLGRLHLLIDWTAGCIAVSNDEIEEIWRVVPNGTPVEIKA
jgi:murein L,D-transpeptidase YafK